MNKKRDNNSMSKRSASSKRQKQQDNPTHEGSQQVKFYFPGQHTDCKSRRGSGGRYSLREFRDPRLGHAQFLKDKFLNPFITLPPHQRPDFIPDPNNPVVGYRFNGIGQPVLPITALDIARETIKSYQNTPSQPLPYGDFSYSGYGYGYGSTGMAPGPTLQLSEADLVRQTIREKEEEAKKLDNKVRDEPEELRKGDLRLAQEAVKFYNATHGTCYELVATLGSYHHLDCGHWYHCNFKAQCKSETNRRPSQAKLFFSELFCPGADMIGAKICTMLDGPGHRPDTVRGCKICGDQLWHPVNGFECGN